MKQLLVDEMKNILETRGKGAKIKVTFTYDDGKKSNERVGLTSSGEVIVLRPRSRTMGCYAKYHFEEVVSIKAVEKKVDVKQQWERSITKAIGMLTESGLWADVKQNLILSLSIGYDKLRKAYTASWETYEGISYDEQEAKRIQSVKNIDSRLIRSVEGKDRLNTEILGYMTHPLKIKKMNFGYANEQILEQISEGLEKKQKVSVSGRTSYDVSLEYDPEIDKAWYSEEYKDCGNGHYYLALNKTHAMFYEDD